MPGYLRFPTVRDGTVIFVHDDDLWSAPLTGGEARRLTTSRAHVSHPKLSPDGSTVAYVAADEGTRDAYLVDARGGTPRRLTWHGDVAGIAAWDGDEVVWVVTSAGRPFARPSFLHAVPVDGSPTRPLPWGPASGADRGPKGQVVLCRHVDDLARWKRYRGGRTGALWVDRKGKGSFERLVDLGGNAANPMFVDGRVWFVSDHEGVGNLYSVRATGKDLRQHTRHEGFFVRHPSVDDKTVVYARGGELWHLEVGSRKEPRPIAIETRASSDQSRRRFVPATRFVQGLDPHPDGRRLAMVVRGKPHAMEHWEGAVRQLGERHGVRYRLPRWLAADRGLLLASDADGLDALEVHGPDGSVLRHAPNALGRPVDVCAPAAGALVAVSNHRQEIVVLDLESGELEVLDRAPGGPIAGMDWSPDGRWLAWARPEASGGSASRICLWNAEQREVVELTDGRHADWCPSWDPDGKLLFFLSRRDYDPVYDAQSFDLGFPRGSRPWAVTLQADQPHPFRATARAIDAKPGGPRRSKEPKEVQVDLEGISHRMVPMPIKESIYQRLVALPGGDLLVSRRGPAGALRRDNWRTQGPPRAEHVLLYWDAEGRELVSVADAITSFGVDAARRTAWLQAGWKHRLFPAKLDKGKREGLKKRAGGPPGRRSGWLDLGRIHCQVEPREEWRQMLEETWRLMRDHFWNAGLSGQDWEAVRARYLPLVDRVATREELSDVLWLMQGELGTSHAYEMGGDLRTPPRWSPGQLGADFAWDGEAWKVERICLGDPGDPQRRSPLLEPGTGIAVGDKLLAIDGVRLAVDRPPARELVNKARQLVALGWATEEGERETVVRTLGSDRTARYRDWVRANRERVHAETDGRCGYVHIPNMGPGGYADFHRDFEVESRRPCLVVDVRYNGGGHVSQLLLEKLARRPLAWTVSRWSGPEVYPHNATLGPMICLTNENAGSDGDIFSHNWKQLGLGPLVGRRTWGGVVGIWPRHRLVDGTITTQPEFAFWFPDVGWGVENRGTAPDVDIDIAPQDWAADRDPQLDHAIGWINDQLGDTTPTPPDFGPAPDLSTP